MAQVSKRKIVKRKYSRKPASKMVVEPTDDGMVVFPMANGKLATTWVSNVDAILSEGTGKLDLKRLKTLKDKLTNSMTLLCNRIAELEIEQTEKAAKEFVQNKIKYVSEHCLGKPVYVTFGGQIHLNAILTYVAIEGDKLHIQGLYPIQMQRDSKTYLAYMHSGIGQIEYKAPLKSLQFKAMDTDSHFIMSSTANQSTIEFGCTMDKDYADTVKTYLTEINEQFHSMTVKPKPKKVKLVLKKHTPKTKQESK